MRAKEKRAGLAGLARFDTALQDANDTPPQPVSVITIKPDGRRILFSRCANHAAALELVAALARLGMPAEIDDRAELPQQPGSLIPEPRQ